MQSFLTTPPLTVLIVPAASVQACLGEPISYEPGEGAYDPLYAPPEKYLLQKQCVELTAPEMGERVWSTQHRDLVIN